MLKTVRAAALPFGPAGTAAVRAQSATYGSDRSAETTNTLAARRRKDTTIGCVATVRMRCVGAPVANTPKLRPIAALCAPA